MAERYYVDPLRDNEYHVLDGDTVKVVLDRGHQDFKRVSLRLLGLDTPENKNTRLGGPLEKKAGIAVGLVVERWIKERKDTHQLYHTSERKPKYSGRTVGRLFAGWPTFAPGGPECLNDYLLEQEVCRPYMGGTKIPWTEDQLNAIIVRAQAILAE